MTSPNSNALSLSSHGIDSFHGTTPSPDESAPARDFATNSGVSALISGGKCLRALPAASSNRGEPRRMGTDSFSSSKSSGAARAESSTSAAVSPWAKGLRIPSDVGRISIFLRKQRSSFNSLGDLRTRSSSTAAAQSSVMPSSRRASSSANSYKSSMSISITPNLLSAE